jgi:large subunit ribosomal protein L1
MAKLSKRQQAIRQKFEKSKIYTLSEAIAILKECATAKFTETVDVAVNLGIDAKKTDQNVRTATSLPHGTGKQVRVAVFTQGANADIAKSAGADLVGMDDLAAQMKSGMMDFDVVIATPDAMRVVGQLGQVLGPKGLMPNPKVGTVTTNVEATIKNVKGGQIRYKSDKQGIVHSFLGNVKFSEQAIIENLQAFLADLKKAKPVNAKGVYIQKVILSTTMGPGLQVDVTSL